MAIWSALLARPSRVPLHLRPSLTLFFLLIGAFFLTFVPQIEQLPFWVSGIVIVSLIIRSVIEIYRLPLPSSLFCGILALCLLGGIVLQFNTMFGRQAGTAFMAGLLAIKFFELRGPRDICVIIFSSFFVVMSTLLYSQALELFIYCLIMMWVLTALLLRVQIGDQREDRLLYMLQRSGVLFLQALPLALFLFFFFPRFAGKLQLSLNEATLGISDTLQPGSIAKLSMDDSPAFYARITSGDVPLVESMYWRALVLWQYDKGLWTQGVYAGSPPEHPSIAQPNSSIIQEITISPHYQRWLFALDHPISPADPKEGGPGWSILLNGNVLQLNRSVGVLDHGQRYFVTSASLLAPSQQPLNANDETYGTELPANIDPDVRKLADTLYQEAGGNDEAYAQAVFKYFRKFSYTPNPGETPPGKDWLHVFLFETKAGFCEHFASAFAVLMRLKHIPARIVVGYHGAQFNPYNNTYIVLQANAHAWDEIWIKSKGLWVRKDPTSMTATQNGIPSSSDQSRVNQGNQDISIQIAHSRLTLLSADHLPVWMRQAMVQMQLRRQQIETNWDDWVFSYDPDAQSALAKALGLGKNPVVLLILFCILAIVLSGYAYRLWIRRPPKASPIETFYTAFCRSMAQRGIPRAVWEGPLAFTGRAAEAFPEKREAIQSVGRIVAHSRYGAPSIQPDEVEKLEKLLALIAASQAASSSRETQEST